MRQLSEHEKFSQMITVHNQREFFMINRTSTMAEWPGDGMEPVYPIRYDERNQWSLR